MGTDTPTSPDPNAQATSPAQTLTPDPTGQSQPAAVAAPPAPTADPNASADAKQNAQPPSLRRQYADWPQKGDTRDQPWDLDKLGVPAADRDLAPGERDTVSPLVIRHQAPILVSGSADPIVADLGRRLDELGYPNSVSRGENPLNIVDESVMSAVDRFREDYGVQEDPTPYGGTSSAAVARAAVTIGPYTWEAVIRASDRLDAEDQ